MKRSEAENEPRLDLRRDQRGAVLAEFVVVLVPLLTIFFVFTQISAMSIARLKLKHAAVVGARAAAVFSNQHQNCPECEGDGKPEITAGVRAALGSTSGVTVTSVEVNDASTTDPYGLVTVTVNATYACNVPLGKIICAGMRPWSETKSMPHQGALYKKE